MPEEEVSYLAVPLGTVQQEVCEGAVIVGLIAQHLHQLQQVLRQLLITGEKREGKKTGRRMRCLLPFTFTHFF